MKALLICIVLLVTSSTYAWKNYVKYGVGGLAVYGAGKLISSLTTSESQKVYESTHVMKRDVQEISEKLIQYERAFNQIDGRITKIENYVEELDRRVTINAERITNLEADVKELQKDVKELKEERIGKKVFLQQLSNGVILKRSLFDIHGMQRLGSKQYSEAGKACHKNVAEDLKVILMSPELNNLFKNVLLSSINIDIIDSTNALENFSPHIQLIQKPEMKKKVLISPKLSKKEREWQKNNWNVDEDSITKSYVNESKSSYKRYGIFYDYELLDKDVHKYDCGSGAIWGTCTETKYLYKVTKHKEVTVPQHSILNIQVPLVSNSDGTTTCQSPVIEEMIEHAINLEITKEVDGLVNPNETSVANINRTKKPHTSLTGHNSKQTEVIKTAQK